MECHIESAIRTDFGIQTQADTHALVRFVILMTIGFVAALFVYFVENLDTCPDPGVPDNGYFKVTSFAVNQMASFGCNTGYKRKGSVLRVCTKSDARSPFWDGQQTKCIGNKKLTHARKSFI